MSQTPSHILFYDESPTKLRTKMSRSISFPNFSEKVNSLNKFNAENESHLAEGKKISTLFKDFTKSHNSVEKFRAFVSWVESKKPYQMRQLYEEIKTFNLFSHADSDMALSNKSNKIKCLALSPNDLYLAVGGEQFPIEIWDLTKKKVVAEMGVVENLKKINCLVMSPASLFSGGWDKVIREWDLSTFSYKKLYYGHEQAVISMTISKDYSFLVSGSEDKMVFLWDLVNETSRKFRPHVSPVSAVEITRTKDLLITASWDKTIKVWKTNDFSLEVTFRKHKDVIRAIALSPCNKILASGGRDKVIKIWDLVRKQLKFSFNEHSSSILTLKFSFYGDYLISGSVDKTIKIWNMQKLRIKKTIEAHNDDITAIEIVSHDDSRFISGSLDSFIKVWMLEKDTEMRLLESSPDTFTALAIFPDNTRAITCQNNQMIKIWNYQEGSQLASAYEENTISFVLIANEGKCILTGDTIGNVALWDSENCFKTKQMPGHREKVVSLKFHKKLDVLVSLAKDSSIIIWSPNLEKIAEKSLGFKGNYLNLEMNPLANFIMVSCLDKIYAIDSQKLNVFKVLEGHTKEITCLKSTSFSRRLLSGSLDKTIKLWNLQTGTIEMSLDTGLEILALELSPDDLTIISSLSDITIRLWDCETGDQISRTRIYKNPMTIMSLSSDGGMLLCTGEKCSGVKRIFLRRIKSKVILQHHKQTVTNLAISPDNTMLAASSNDLSISLWDLDKMKLLHVFQGYTKKIDIIAFTPNSKHLVSGGDHHSLKIWTLHDKNFEDAFTLHSDSISDMLIYENGSKLLTACKDNSLMLFDLNEKKLLSSLFFNHSFTRLLLNHAENSVYTGNKTGAILELDLNTFQERKQAQGEFRPVKALAISPDDRKLFTSSSEFIRIWGVGNRNFSLIGILAGHSSKVYSLIINTRGTKLFSGSSDSKIFIWDIVNEKKIAALEGHTGPVRKLALSDANEDTLYSCSDDKTIRSWNLKDSKPIPFMNGHVANIKYMVFSPDDKYLISGDENDTLIVWDLSKKKAKCVLTNNENCAIQGIALTSDGSKLISCTNKTKKTIWDIDLGRKIAHFEYPLAYPQKMVLASNDKNVIIAYSDLKIRSWSLDKLVIERVFQGSKGNIMGLVLTKSMNTLFCGGEDRKILVWDYFYSEEPKAFLKEHTEYITALALNKSNTLLVSADTSKVILVWSVYNLTLIKTITGLPGPAVDLCVSPDDRRLFVPWKYVRKDEDDDTNSDNRFVYVWSLQDFQLVSCNVLTGINGVAISNEQKEIATCQEKTILLWNYLLWQNPSTLSGTLNKITAETMTVDRDMIILADADHSIIVWDLMHKNKVVKFQGHTDSIAHLIATSNKNVISASSDKTIKIWSIEEKRLIDSLETHLSPINAIAVSENEEFLLSTSSKSGIILWDLNLRQQIRQFLTHEDFIYGLFIFPDNKKFMSAGDHSTLLLWDLENEEKKPIKLIVFNIIVSRMMMSPDLKILLVFSVFPEKMQIWDMINYTLINEIDYPSTRISKPIFLSNENNRLILCADQLIDCFTGTVIFRFLPNEEIFSYFYDYNNQSFFFISDSFRLFQFNQDWLATYLFNYLAFDSILSLKKNINEICNRPMSTFPFLFSFLHLAAIFDKNQEFSLQKMKQIYAGKGEDTFFNNFYNVDIFLNTPLDVLIQRKNTTLMVKYFKMLCEAITDRSVSFYQKARFFSYNFKENYSFIDLLCEIINLMGEDLQSVSFLLDQAFIKFDHAIYDNFLVYQEIDQPLYIETNSVYIDEEFLKERLDSYFSQKNVDKTSIELETKSMVKAKILVIPDIFDINNKKTLEFYNLISNRKIKNKIFNNETLSVLVNFIWDKQVKSYYLIEFYVFFFFFMLFNINFAILFETSLSQSDDSWSRYLSKTIDVILLLYSLFTMANESIQLRNNFSNYFKSIWNYVDIAMIPLLMFSSIFDFSLYFVDYGDYISLLQLWFSACMFAFWFRLLSFSRGFKETSSMVRLIFEVISSVKYFVLFMVLFMLTLSSSLFLLRNGEVEYSFWYTLLLFYSCAVGDTEGITDYETVYGNLDDYFMVIATFLFAIIAVNLLVSIIGDKHNDNKENEEKTRTYELLYIIVDMQLSLVYQITRKIKEEINNSKFLIKVFNEQHEKADLTDNDLITEKLEKIQTSFDEEISKMHKKIDKNIKSNEEILNLFENYKMANEMHHSEIKKLLSSNKEKEILP